MAELLSDRLFALLMREVARLEEDDKDVSPMARAAPRSKAEAGAEAKSRQPARAGFKERADALGLLTRTLEKLLELRALEASAGRDDETETLRLREDFMRQLRALDARRVGGPRLFAGSDGTEAAAAAPKAAKGRGRTARPKATGRGADGA
ncbi:hypothetical protein [Jiella avicenniae]|uniref:Uncharacterized protein n=1 Tax=Jiella avicenniae TaxID=2907202 RepID=A0A9X1NY16_9HYPH|nr:hypothetical protein [Jiella avicenniae]MCE7027008.1 hypothetical protein [Jiella avicenniae]